jgi:dTDP-4-dehydrorhamnose reductase
MNKTLIFGNGYIGNKFKERLPGAIISPADITDAAAVKAALAEHKPDVVINCAGKTGRPNVDWCEGNKEATLASNVHGPLTLARACKENGAYLVHIGSGCVYEGDNNGKGFSEDDPPNFFGSFYSMTKILSEHGLKRYPALQLRLRMPLDSVPGPRNFVTKITSYQKVISVPNSISVIDDFLTAAIELIRQRKTGIYNLTNPGAITHEEILELYKEIVDPAFTYTLIPTHELDKMTKARRSNCVLNTDKLAAEGIRMPPIKDAVRKALHEYKKHIG